MRLLKHKNAVDLWQILKIRHSWQVFFYLETRTIGSLMQPFKYVIIHRLFIHNCITSCSVLCIYLVCTYACSRYESIVLFQDTDLIIIII